MVSPAHKRRAVQVVVETGLCSQRRAFRYLALNRSSGRYEPQPLSDWFHKLRRRIEALSRKYPSMGYRKLRRLLHQEGWQVGRKLVQRIRRDCDLRLKRAKSKKRRRGRSTGVIPTRAEYINHVLCWDFIADRTDNGGKLRVLSLIDEHTRECVAVHVARKIVAADLIAVMERVIAERGVPGFIRSDNGPEFIAKMLQRWLAAKSIKTLYIEPGSPWQNGFAESFNGSLRAECIDRELLLSVAEARVVVNDFKDYYNNIRPHGGIGYRTPAQARLEALGSCRPTGSIRQELDPIPSSVTLTIN